jgi:competence ComEA-like helix-hairpin-helix protein
MIKDYKLEGMLLSSYNSRMKSKEGKLKLGPAWWIAYGVVIGLGAAGFILLVASPPRGEAVRLLPAPTRAASFTPEPTEMLPTETATITPIPTVSFPLNINTATAQELEQLPGIGPALAQNIFSYRDAHGPFTSVGQIQRVPDIGPITYEAILPFINVDEP